MGAVSEANMGQLLRIMGNVEKRLHELELSVRVLRENIEAPRLNPIDAPVERPSMRVFAGADPTTKPC